MKVTTTYANRTRFVNIADDGFDCSVHVEPDQSLEQCLREHAEDMRFRAGRLISRAIRMDLAANYLEMRRD